MVVLLAPTTPRTKATTPALCRSVVAWCDGSSHVLPGSTQHGAGVVIWGAQLPQLKTAYRYFEAAGAQSSANSELSAAILALEQVPLDCPRVILVSDSQEVVDACVALSIRRASVQQALAARPFSPRLFDTLRTLLTESLGREHLFLKVKGHALSPGNVLADKLATRARTEKRALVELSKIPRALAQEARAYVRGEVPVLSGRTVRVAGALVPAANKEGALNSSSLTPALRAQVKEQTHIVLTESQLATIRTQAQRLIEQAEALPARTHNQIAAKEKAVHSAKTYASRAARNALRVARLKAL